MSEQTKTAIESLLSAATWINSVLFAGLTLAAVIVLIKLLGKTEFDFKGVKIPMGHAWLIFFVFTVCHFYTTWTFMGACTTLFHRFPDEVRFAAWEQLTNTGPLFFRGLLPRLNYVPVIGSNGQEFRLYVMDMSDPTTWLAHAAAIVLFVAIVRLRKTTWTVRLCTIVAGIFLMIANWTIGTHWVVGASELRLDDKSKSFLMRHYQ